MTAKPVPEHISDELLAKMLAAAENAGGREWFTDPRPTAEGLAVVDDGASMWPVKCEWPQAQFVALANPAALIALLTELQHRREAEAGAPEGWVLVPREPTIDMASAGWDAIMAHTGFHEVDDRAEKAYRAMLAASPSSPASGVRVKALEWVQNWPSDPLTGFAKVDHINRTYTVDHDGPRFYASTNVSPSDYSGDAIGNYGTFDEAKAACQADYEARIRSALGEHP